MTNTLYGVISTVLYGGGRFLVLLLLAKFYPADDLGGFILAWAVVTPSLLTSATRTASSAP